jgi:hypothetical protein
MQTQNNGLKYLLSFFFFDKKQYNNSIISINVTHTFKAKANFDATNNNSYAL